MCELILQGASDLNLNVTKRNIFNHIKCKAGRPNRHCDRRHPFSKQFSYRRVTAKTKFLFDHLWSYHSGGYNLLIRVCCNACPLWRRGNRHNYFTKALWISVANQLEKFQSVFAWNFTAAFVSTTACLVLLINFFPHFTPLVLWLQLIESLRWLFRTFEMLLWGIKHYSQWFWAYIYIHVCVFMFFLISWGLDNVLLTIISREEWYRVLKFWISTTVKRSCWLEEILPADCGNKAYYNPCASFPSVTVFIPLSSCRNSLVFVYLSRPLFCAFLSFD